MKQNVVSVILPAYNAAQYIVTALKSVESQTYIEWEVIVVDDASKDNTKAIVQSFVENSNGKVRFFENATNQGASITRNRAIEFAQGEYLAFLDADDFWEINHLETSLKHLKIQQADVVYSPIQTFEERENRVSGTQVFSKSHLETFPVSLLVPNCPIYPTSVVMKHAVLDGIKLFDPQLKITQDVDFFIRIAAAGHKFFCIEEATVFLRRGHDSLSSNQKKTKEDFTQTIRKNLHVNIGTQKERYDIASMWHLAVAKDNLKEDPLKAVKFLFLAWRMRPAKIKYLAGAMWAIGLFCKKSIATSCLRNS